MATGGLGSIARIRITLGERGFLVRECLVDEVEFVSAVRFQESQSSVWEGERSVVHLLCVYAYG